MKKCKRRCSSFSNSRRKLHSTFRNWRRRTVKAESRISRLGGAVVGVVNLIDRLTNAQERTDASVNELAIRMNELADSQKRTDDRLNILINSVERYISEARNGKPPERT